MASPCSDEMGLTEGLVLPLFLGSELYGYFQGDRRSEGIDDKNLAAFANAEVERVMFLSRASLFLGRCTNLLDGISFILELKNEISEELWDDEMGMAELELEDEVQAEIKVIMVEVRA